MPVDADLQIGNSWSIRMSQLLDIPATVRQYCNRGVNGIDGSLSTAVGFGATNERLTYLVIGDLSFLRYECIVDKQSFSKYEDSND